MSNKTTKGERVACLLLATLIIMTRCNLYQRVIAKSPPKEVVFCEEKEMVSLRTIVATNNPEPEIVNTISEQPVEQKCKLTLKVIKAQKIKVYKSIKEVKSELSVNIDLSKPSGLSKKDFVNLMKKLEYDYTGFFKRNSEFVWNLAQKYKFNEIFFMAVIANESLWASSDAALATNNYTSQMSNGELIHYSSEKDCLEVSAKNIGKNYLRKDGKYYNGKTVYAVNELYCEPGVHKDGTPYKYKWADDVYRCMEMIIG